jgi:hypothetical protein
MSPIEEGIDPLKQLEYIDRYVSEDSFPTVVGILP